MFSGLFFQIFVWRIVWKWERSWMTWCLLQSGLTKSCFRNILLLYCVTIAKSATHSLTSLNRPHHWERKVSVYRPNRGTLHCSSPHLRQPSPNTADWPRSQLSLLAEQLPRLQAKRTFSKCLRIQPHDHDQDNEGTEAERPRPLSAACLVFWPFLALTSSMTHFVVNTEDQHVPEESSCSEQDICEDIRVWVEKSSNVCVGACRGVWLSYP